MTVKDLDECEYRCYLDANCVSLNIRNKDPNGIHECELNNSTHLENDSHLKDDHLFYYRGGEVSDYTFFFFLLFAFQVAPKIIGIHKLPTKTLIFVHTF